ncbi:MAG: thioredoxin family protein [Eubacteriales bacterium]|nr:thioredoxin family protein [Eubacteriales bacterium]
MIKNVSYQELKLAVAEGFHLVDAYGTHCGPCKILSATLEQIEREYPMLSILKINTDEEPEFTHDMCIRAVPTLFLYQEGEVIQRLSGALGHDELVALFGPHLYD